MTRLATAVLLLAITLGSALARAEFAEGVFSMVNTAAFSEVNGTRIPLGLEQASAEVTMAFHSEGRLNLKVGDADIVLFPIASGLNGLTWDSHGSSLLHESDVAALNLPQWPESVPAWGADLAWPGLGAARLVMLPLGADAYVGFLVSHPNNRKVVRQMEFRRLPGPKGRPN